jgi:hypothetical protein
VVGQRVAVNARPLRKGRRADGQAAVWEIKINKKSVELGEGGVEGGAGGEGSGADGGGLGGGDRFGEG